MTVTVVDAFADRPFSGNPAAVCVLDAPAPEEWMRGLASEMNLSETAFLTPGDDGAYVLRWLTPEYEVDLCGHATLASAHVLFETARLGPDAVARFDTKSGRLTVRRVGEATYTMDFPATPPSEARADGLAEVLGTEPAWTGRTPFDLFAVLASEAEVRALRPDLSALQRIEARGLIVTAPADEATEADVVSRFFAPGAGVPEIGHGLGALCHRAVLGGATGADACVLLPGLTPGRSRRRRGARRPRRADGRAITVYRAELAPTARP